MDFDKKEVARQLCLLEYEYFSKILPTECLNQSWNKSQKETKAPNIIAIIRRFNEVSISLVSCDAFITMTSSSGELLGFFRNCYNRKCQSTRCPHGKIHRDI
jgi:hypothetical protein